MIIKQEIDNKGCLEAYEDKDGIALYCVGMSDIQPFKKTLYLCPKCKKLKQEEKK